MTTTELRTVMEQAVARAWPNMHLCHHERCAKRREENRIPIGVSPCAGCEADWNARGVE